VFGEIPGTGAACASGPLPAARGASGFAGRAAPVTGMVMARFSVAVSPQVVLADVQAGKQPAREAEPAKYAGRDERAGHVVLH
jgi:hypothetical protein